MEPSELYGVAREHALNLIDQGKESEVIDEVLARFKAVTGRGRDFHVVVGGDYNSAASIQNHLTIAAALGIDFYGVGSFPRDAVPAEVTHTVSAALMAASDAHGHCRMSGMVLNRLPASADLDAIRATLAKRDVQPLALMEHSAALEEVRPPALQQIPGQCAYTYLLASPGYHPRQLPHSLASLCSLHLPAQAHTEVTPVSEPFIHQLICNQ